MKLVAASGDLAKGSIGSRAPPLLGKDFSFAQRPYIHGVESNVMVSSVHQACATRKPVVSSNKL